MVATAALVMLRLSPAAVSSRPRVGTALFPSVAATANLCGSGGVVSVLAAKTPAERRRGRRHAVPTKLTAVRTSTTVLLRKGAVSNKVSTAIVEEDDEDLEVDRTSRRIIKIKAMLGSMGDGDINTAAYDTAWVALVPDLSGKGGPQFPSSLRWIEDNQLPDGSWGDPDFFMTYDRLLNTLACVIALKSWGICPDQCQRGISFIRDNIHRLEKEDEEQLPCGFEVVFPSLIEMARSLDLEVPYDAPALRDICARRASKLERIPKDMVHTEPTTLLYSLEGVPDLDWEKLLPLQNDDGSFLTSPSSTAFALMQTGDAKCLAYLENIVQNERFNGGVPDFYPLDFMERLWAVDRLERLGISRYFQEEIGQCLDYVHRYWTEDGIGWARNSRIKDVDDTSMGFRLLRLHGYDVSSDVFRHFVKDGGFFCLDGELNRAITHTYNLNRTSHVSFLGEKILQEARTFSYKFLREKQTRNELSDKWIIAKDLAGEVGYALDFPWYASLPRVETRLYLDQYGGNRDVWISKTLYRMPPVSNDDYLELARSDFSRCQLLHQQEWLNLRRWHAECGLRWHGVRWRSLLRSYFLAAASIFEPERAAERLAWTHTAVLAEAVSAHLRGGHGDACFMNEMKQALSTHADRNIDDATSWLLPGPGGRGRGCGLVGALLYTLDRLSSDVVGSLPPGDVQAAAAQRQILQHLRRAWGDWMLAWRKEEEEGPHAKGWWPAGPDNDETGLLLVRSVELCAGRTGLEESLQADPPHRQLQQQQKQSPHQYAQPTRLISSLSRKLRDLHQRNLFTAELLYREGDEGNGNEEGGAGGDAPQDVEPDMQELIMHVLRNPSGGSRNTLQTFLTVAKSFYYVATCPPNTLEHHIAKVLFEDTV